MTAMTEAATPGPNASTIHMIRVWDPLVRVFHWGLVAAFSLAWLTADEVQPVHELAGYTVAGLVAFRVVWGLVGGRYARFARFLASPRRTLAYLGDMRRGTERRYIGHNPAGAAMIVALLVTLSGTALTGWLMDEPARLAMASDLPRVVAPAWADDDGDGDDGDEDGHAPAEHSEADGLLKEVHETLATLMLVLAALHVGGVVLASVRHHENLARAMVTGEKRAPGPDDIA